MTRFVTLADRLVCSLSIKLDISEASDLRRLLLSTALRLQAIEDKRLAPEAAADKILDALISLGCRATESERFHLVRHINALLDNWNLQRDPEVALWNELNHVGDERSPSNVDRSATQISNASRPAPHRASELGGTIRIAQAQALAARLKFVQ